MNFKGSTYNFAEFINFTKQELDKYQQLENPEPLNKNVYLDINLKRILRINKTLVLRDDLKETIQQLEEKLFWTVITEAWCGDSAQSLPVLAAIAEASQGMIELKVILRDENPEIMNQFLTNGSQSIPKLFAMNSNSDIVFQWGPRPKAAQELLINWKTTPNSRSHDDFEKELHTWYAKDKGESVQLEFKELLTKLIETAKV